MLSIVVPVLNWLDFTKKIIDNIDKNIQDYELIIIDDWSTDWTKEYLNTLTDKKYKIIINEEHKWVTYSWNKWIENSNGDFIMVINNDILFVSGVVQWMMEYLKQNHNVWILSPLEYRINEPWNWQIITKEGNIWWSCWMIKKEQWELIWPIDERISIRFNDDRLFHKLKDIWLDFERYRYGIMIHFLSQTVGHKKEDNPMIWNKISKDRDQRITILKEKNRKDQRFII